MKRHQGWIVVGLLVAIALPVTVVGRQWINRDAESAIAVFPLTRQMPDGAGSASRVMSLNSSDEADIASVIRQQIDAFQNDDAERAFSFASPSIRKQFQTAERFLAMVQSEYAAVYRPQSVTFGDIQVIRGNPVQAVMLLGPAGEWVTAYYQMEQLPNEAWRIAGCVLIPVEGETI